MKENNLSYPKDNMGLMYFQHRSCAVRKKVREDQVDKGKRGIEKQAFQLIDFTATGIEKIIQGYVEKDSKATRVHHYPSLFTQPLDRSALEVPNSAESEKPAPPLQLQHLCFLYRFHVGQQLPYDSRMDLLTLS
ncbi:hypothetical protein COLO4_34905 [Corchorus olitorius]|uniref:Uncharacterized protein n=1 Tax=Corchorus olitorius TaxID=93759 RepID=A0A1R3GIX8_9ROSI|nr:hypothetical protein COLO4_34905 [Corchorus olitorius]